MKDCVKKPLRSVQFWYLRFYSKVLLMHSVRRASTILAFVLGSKNRLSKDTPNPLSHHVMASSNSFSSTQALAPTDRNVKDAVNSTFELKNISTQWKILKDADKKYHENHRSAEWIQIFTSLPRPLSTSASSNSFPMGMLKSDSNQPEALPVKKSSPSSMKYTITFLLKLLEILPVILQSSLCT